MSETFGNNKTNNVLTFVDMIQLIYKFNLELLLLGIKYCPVKDLHLVEVTKKT
jgi:hypothetical protein